MRNGRTREIGFFIFLLALGLRAIYYLQSEANPLLMHSILDESYYIDLGQRIAGGFWLGEDRVFFMDPLYGYLLGLVFGIFGGGPEWVRILQVVLDSLNAVMIFYLGRRIWSLTAGVVAGLLYAGYKVSFFYTLLFLKTTVTITFLLLFVILLLHVLHRDRARGWLLLGASCALMVYLQANLLAIAPLTLVLSWFLQKPKGVSKFLKHSLCFVAGLAVFLAPGAFRNHHVSGEWIWLNTQSGRLLYSSNNPGNLTGRYNVPPFARPHPEESEKDFHAEAERRTGVSLSARDASRYWSEQTWHFLKSHPREVLTLLKNKVLGTVTDHEIPVDHSFELNERFAGTSRWPLPTFGLAFALGIPGLALGLVRRKETAVLMLPIATTLLTILLFYTSSRFRMPLLPFLIVGAGIGVDRLLVWCRGKRIRAALGFVLAVLALFFFSTQGIRPQPTGTEEFYLAKAYWMQGKHEEATRVASDAMRRFPDQARFPALLGMAALSQSRFEEAIRLNQEALRLDPSYADAFHNLGLAFLLTGKGKEAIEAVERALSISENSRYFFTLAKGHESVGNRSEAIRLYGEYLKRSKPSDPYRKDAEERLSTLQKVQGRSMSGTLLRRIPVFAGLALYALLSLAGMKHHSAAWDETHYLGLGNLLLKHGGGMLPRRRSTRRSLTISTACRCFSATSMNPASRRGWAGFEEGSA